MDHIHNGEVKTFKDGTIVGGGGHYIRDPNIKIDKVMGALDANGVSTGYISVRDPATGQWMNKKALTIFFPKQWSKRQTVQEIESAFKTLREYLTQKCGVEYHLAAWKSKVIMENPMGQEPLHSLFIPGGKTDVE